MALKVGTKAPDFTLKTKTAEGLKDVKLSDNFGKKQTVLLFFPLAFTGVCTQEMCDQSSGLGDYEKLGAEVIAISVDSPFAQEAWAQKNFIKLTIGDFVRMEMSPHDLDKGRIIFRLKSPTPRPHNPQAPRRHTSGGRRR